MPLSAAYSDAIETESLGYLHGVLDTFFAGFDPAKPTIVLLPGGLGTTLHQSWFAFSGTPQPSYAPRSTIWMDFGLLFGDAHRLSIDPDGYDTHHKIVIAETDVDFCFVHPLKEAVDFFRNTLGANVLMFGWDWRRGVMRATDLLAATLHEMRSRALNQTGFDVLLNTWLVGHSMGGMISKLLMTHHPHFADDLAGMISVGTPFYGYFGQMERIYEGDSLFNDLYTPLQVATITSSWPGMYSLLPIDMPTYQNVGAQIGLGAYPVVTAGTGQPADAYNANTLNRFPGWVRTADIPVGLTVRHALAAPLSGNNGKKVYHIRARVPISTSVGAVWNANIPPNYTPGNGPPPITFTDGEGDDTIPYWSAALASTPGGNQFECDTGSHALLMEERWVLAAIQQIITGAPFSADEVRKAIGEQPPVATRAEAERVIDAIARGEIDRRRRYDPERGPIIAPEILRRFMVEWGT